MEPNLRLVESIATVLLIGPSDPLPLKSGAAREGLFVTSLPPSALLFLPPEGIRLRVEDLHT